MLQAGWQVSILQAGWQVSVLQAGWQVSVDVWFVRPVALVYRLLAVTTASGLCPARVVTSFVRLMVVGVLLFLSFQNFIFLRNPMFHLPFFDETR